MFKIEDDNEMTARVIYRPSGALKRFRVVLEGAILYVAMSVNNNMTAFHPTASTIDQYTEIVQKIIFKDGTSHLQDLRANWQKDLTAMASLEDNWDEEGACRTNHMAIMNTDRIVSALDKKVSSGIRLFPTPLGAVMIKLETEKGRLKGEIGDELFSYFVKCPNENTEHHSFEELNPQNIELLRLNLSRLI